MRTFRIKAPFLINARVRQTVFLTLLLTVLLPFSKLHATDYTADETTFVSVPMYAGKPVDSALASDERSHRITLLGQYVRDEGPNWLPGLPHNMLRDPAGWVKHSLGFGGRSANVGNPEDASASLFAPLTDMMAPPAVEQAQALWLSPTYHHKGFLPLDDAMIMGVNLRHRVWGERMQFDVHPYYGQNWLSTSGYYGTEFSLGMKRPGAVTNWGNVSFRYINGNADLMDNGRGFDMHSEINFSDSLSLNTGVRRDEDSSLGNYTLLRWKVALN